METTEGNNMKLTRNERKMVIGHEAQMCADNLPADNIPDYWITYDAVIEHHWMKLLTALGQTHRDHHAAGWDELVVFIRSADNLDRDPAGHMYGLGEDDTEQNREFWYNHYNDVIGMHIDNISYRAS
jgi:hypothetical protein